MSDLPILARANTALINRDYAALAIIGDKLCDLAKDNTLLAEPLEIIGNALFANQRSFLTAVAATLTAAQCWGLPSKKGLALVDRVLTQAENREDPRDTVRACGRICALPILSDEQASRAFTKVLTAADRIQSPETRAEELCLVGRRISKHTQQKHQLAEALLKIAPKILVDGLRDDAYDCAVSFANPGSTLQKEAETACLANRDQHESKLENITFLPILSPEAVLGGSRVQTDLQYEIRLARLKRQKTEQQPTPSQIQKFVQDSTLG